VYQALIESEAFELLQVGDRRDLVEALVIALVNIDAAYLDKFPDTPLLYASGVTYQDQMPGHDVWQDIPRLLKTKRGACEDLAAWRVAELNAAGETGARIDVTTYPAPNGRDVTYHITVSRGDGSKEDPSAHLGMGTPIAHHSVDIF